MGRKNFLIMKAAVNMIVQYFLGVCLCVSETCVCLLR